MKNAILGIVILLVIGAAVGGFIWKQRGTPEASREELVEKLVAVLPDSLGEDHVREIRGLFDTLWYRADRGLVATVDLDSITTHMREFVDAGSISGKDLVHLMAEVGYKTYKGEARYNLPDGEVDHPVLNPSSAMIEFWPDTTGYTEWLKEQKRKGEEAKKEREKENK